MRIGNVLASMVPAAGLLASIGFGVTPGHKWTQKTRYVPFERDGAAHFSKAEAKRARKAEKLKRDMAKGAS